MKPTPGMSSATMSGATAYGRGSAEALVALGLSAGPVVALGFTRFAYALLLPSMREQLHWDFAASGGMNTANAIGYVLGARVHGGACHQRSTFLVALYMSGVGVGIVLSGLVIPATIGGLGATGWRLGWLAMGVLAALALPPALWAARRAGASVVSATDGLEPVNLRRLAPAFVWYILFGAGYVSYMTFVVACCTPRVCTSSPSPRSSFCSAPLRRWALWSSGSG